MRQQLLVPAGVRVLLFNRLSRTQSLPTSARLPLPGAAYPIFMPAGERSAHDYCSGRTRVEQDSEELASVLAATALRYGLRSVLCRLGRRGRRFPAERFLPARILLLIAPPRVGPPLRAARRPRFRTSRVPGLSRRVRAA